jgi:rhodanese-related sulfurtransferase
VGGPDTWVQAGDSADEIRRVDFDELVKEWKKNPAALVIDTRQILEWESGHVDGAVFIPFYEVLDRMVEIPTEQDVFIYCGSGYRASAVASLLQHHGYNNVIHVDDSFSNAAGAGLAIVSETPPAREPGWTWTASRANVRTFEPGKVGAQ